MLAPAAREALPADEAAIAFAPAVRQAPWIREGSLTSRRLTEIYLERIERHAGRLECFVIVTRERALAEADAADRTLRERGPSSPLHGVPYGLKDIVDVAAGSSRSARRSSASSAWRRRNRRGSRPEHRPRARGLSTCPTSPVNGPPGAARAGQLLK